MRKHLLAASIVIATALGVPTPATAQPSAQSSAMAEALFQQGRALMDEKQYDQACPKLAQSQKLEPKLGTLLNLAVCHESLGKTASAWAEFTTVVNLARRAGRTKRQLYAQKHVEALTPRLSRLNIKIAVSTPDLAITVDGKPFDAAMADTPLPMDPGRHNVEVTAPGKMSWAKSIVVVGEGETQVLEIPALSDDPNAATATPTPGPAPGPEPAKPPTSDPGSDEAQDEGGVPMLAWVGFGIGGAGLVVGAATGIMTLTKAGDIKDACTDGTCPAEQEDELSSATTLANVSNVGFAIAGAGVALGLVALFTMGGDDEQEPSARTWVRPTVGIGSLGIEGRF